MNSRAPKWADAPVRVRGVTPEEALCTLSDVVRLCRGEDIAAERGDDWIIEADQSLDLLLADLDFDDSPETAKDALDRIFAIELPTSELAPMLAKAAKFTVGDLCHCIAHHAMTNEIEPAQIMGRQSWEAEVFRVIRRTLADAGADVSTLKPSSRLEPYLKDHGERLCLLTSRIAPGSIAPHIEPVYSCFCSAVDACGRVITPIAFSALLLGLGMQLFIGSVLGDPILLIAIPLVIAVYVGALLRDRVPPRGYRWGEMVTFADLSSALAARLRTGSK